MSGWPHTLGHQPHCQAWAAAGVEAAGARSERHLVEQAARGRLPGARLRTKPFVLGRVAVEYVVVVGRSGSWGVHANPPGARCSQTGRRQRNEASSRDIRHGEAVPTAYCLLPTAYCDAVAVASSPAASRSVVALSVFSQVKSWSSRPKWP